MLRFTYIVSLLCVQFIDFLLSCYFTFVVIQFIYHLNIPCTSLVHHFLLRFEIRFCFQISFLQFFFLLRHFFLFLFLVSNFLFSVLTFFSCCRYSVCSSFSLCSISLSSKVSNAKNTVVWPNFLVYKFYGKVQFAHSFGWITQNYAQTVPFYKIYTPGN